MSPSMDNGVSSPSQVRKFLGGVIHVSSPPLILGAVLTHNSEAGPVSVRLTEVEAYMGPRDSEHPDPRFPYLRWSYRPECTNVRAAGFPLRLLHLRHALLRNIVCGPDGSASALLLRAGEIVDGG